MRYHYTASVTVYSMDDEFSEKRTITDYVEADSFSQAKAHVKQVIVDITAEWSGDEIDWPVQRTEVHRVTWNDPS